EEEEALGADTQGLAAGGRRGGGYDARRHPAHFDRGEGLERLLAEPAGSPHLISVAECPGKSHGEVRQLPEPVADTMPAGGEAKGEPAVDGLHHVGVDVIEADLVGHPVVGHARQSGSAVHWAAPLEIFERPEGTADPGSLQGYQGAAAGLADAGGRRGPADDVEARRTRGTRRLPYEGLFSLFSR